VTSRRVLVAALPLAFVLAACSGGGTDPVAGGTDDAVPTTASADAATGTDSATAGGETDAARVARIGVLATLTGERGAVGRGLRDAVELAADEASEQELVPGWRFEVVAVDDGGSQSEGQQAASRLSGTADLIGVVGSLGSSVDEGMQPILNNAGVPMVAPAAGATHLTRRVRAGADVRPFPTYFRLAPRTSTEPVAAARFAAGDGVRTATVVDDGSGYGRGLTAGFRAAAAERGIRVVGGRSVDVGDDVESDDTAAGFAAAAAAVDRRDTRLRGVRGRGDGLDLVFFGGSADAAGVFGSALREAGVEVPMMGGDALLGEGFEQAEGGRTGDLAVFSGVPAEAVDAGQDFLSRYDESGAADPAGPFGATGHDAASLLVRAFGSVVGERESVTSGVRSDVVVALGTQRSTGITGPLAFDGFGDRLRPRMTVYRLADSGTWRPVRTVSAAP
jgi:branched-chain amino acid transport system substrate-binding protein